MEGLTKGQIELIAQETARIVIRTIKETRKDDAPRRMITIREAAHMLGVTETHVRRIKDMLTHTKVGNHKQGRLLFDANCIMEDYERYQLGK